MASIQEIAPSGGAESETLRGHTPLKNKAKLASFRILQSNIITLLSSTYDSN
jgi:hypothetical protein